MRDTTGMLASEEPERTAAYRIAGAALVVAIATILAALAFEHLGGYAACPLCLQQRYAYYAGIPLLFIAMALVGEMPRLAAVILLLVGLAFLANAGLGGYQAGAEWGFWPGPSTCFGVQALSTTAADLLDGLEQGVVRCDEASWRFAGISFAGWNAILSAALGFAALRAAQLATGRAV